MASAGQDQWILEQFPEGYKGIALDVGANNGEFESNTLLLEDKGWDVLCIEADPRFRLPLILSRKSFLLCAINGTGGDWATFHAGDSPTASEQMLVPRRGTTSLLPRQLRVPVMTLDIVLHMFGFERLDVLSMDIEGGELDALQGINLNKWTPKVIVCEDLDNELLLAEYLTPYGYKFAGTRQYDRCFVRGDE